MTIIEMAFGLFSLLLTGGSIMLWHKVNKIEDKAEQANSDLSKFKIDVTKDVDQANKDLGDFKLYVAKEHPTNENFTKAVDGLSATLNDVFKAIHGVKDDIQNMSNTFRDKLEQKADRNH